MLIERSRGDKVRGRETWFRRGRNSKFDSHDEGCGLLYSTISSTTNITLRRPASSSNLGPLPTNAKSMAHSVLLPSKLQENNFKTAASHKVKDCRKAHPGYEDT